MSTTAAAKPKVRVQVRRNTFRGVAGWLVTAGIGTKTVMLGVTRMWTASEEEARRMAADLRAGRAARFDDTIARSATKPQCDACTDLERFLARPENVCFCTSEQMARKPLVQTMEALAEIAEQLRSTAAGLRAWSAHQPCSGNRASCVHPNHAAKRLDKIAERINSTTKESK